MIIPKALTRGSTIAIAAPAGAINDNSLFHRGVKILHELGYKTKFPRDLWPGHGYLADDDFNRAREFQQLWNDPDVEAIIGSRGGYGCLRIAEKIFDGLDLSQSKMLIGFSDITILHQLLNQRGKVASYHGPVVTSLPHLSQSSIRNFAETLKTGPGKWCHHHSGKPIQKGAQVQGINAGGNLSTIISTIGTPLMPNWKNKIVFLEDTSEHAYRIDRMLTQLKMAGMFKGLAALILGDFSHGLDLDRNGVLHHHETVWTRALELVEKDTIVWADFPIGHGETNHTFPLGVEMVVDSEKMGIYSV